MSVPGQAATVDRLRQLVQDALLPQELVIRDDSAAHAGHTSAGGKGHYRMRIVASRFSGMPAIERHRLVHRVLGALFENDIHALALETLAPEEKR
jgi:BolA family transcriptional regulator, general stress-responsive regulator